MSVGGPLGHDISLWVTLNPPEIGPPTAVGAMPVCYRSAVISMQHRATGAERQGMPDHPGDRMARTAAVPVRVRLPSGRADRGLMQVLGSCAGDRRHPDRGQFSLSQRARAALSSPGQSGNSRRCRLGARR
jgi:hypothetical protein